MQAGELRGGQYEPIVQVTKHPDSVPVQYGGKRSHDPREDLRRGRQTKGENPELVRLAVNHETQKTTGVVMNRNLQVCVL